MNLYLCTATSPIGLFSDYVLATNRDEAIRAFRDLHGLTPNHVQLERKLK